METKAIQKEVMDSILKPEKGWICNITGNEYVYDFHLKYYPIIIKVLSTVCIDPRQKRNKGSDYIRVFSVEKNGMDVKSPILGGLTKAILIEPDKNWVKTLKTIVCKTIELSKKRYDRR